MDLGQLETLINEGKTFEEIKKATGVKSKTSYLNAILQIQLKTGKPLPIPDGLLATGEGRGGRGPSNRLRAGKQGLKLSPAKMRQLGIELDTLYTAKKREDGVIELIPI